MGQGHTAVALRKVPLTEIYAQALLPLVVHAIGETGILPSCDSTSHGASSTESGKRRATRSSSSAIPLYIQSASAVVAVHASSASNTTISLGLSHAFTLGTALVLVEVARAEAQQSNQNASGVTYSANGFLAQPDRPVLSAEESTSAVVRDVSAAATIGTGIAALTLEGAGFGGLAYYGLGQAMGNDWVLGQAVLGGVYALGTVIVHMAMLGSLLIMVSMFHTLSYRKMPIHWNLWKHATQPRDRHGLSPVGMWWWWRLPSVGILQPQRHTRCSLRR